MSLSVLCMCRLANKQDLSSAVDVSVVQSSLHVDRLAHKYNFSLHAVSITHSISAMSSAARGTFTRVG